VAPVQTLLRLPRRPAKQGIKPCICHGEPGAKRLVGYYVHRPYNVQTNSVGFRNTEEPSASAFQMLAVGDSQTFGPYLANEALGRLGLRLI
jgi:hypothetical protein